MIGGHRPAEPWDTRLPPDGIWARNDFSALREQTDIGVRFGRVSSDIAQTHLPHRRDGVRNRVAILAAAARVFSRDGIDAPLDAVAREAGVGRATLYRNFADRDALLAALLQSDLDELDRAIARKDGRSRFFHLLELVEHHFGERAAIYPALERLMHDAAHRAALRSRLVGMFRAPLAEAAAAGSLRADVQLADMPALLRMIAAVALDGHELRPPAQRRRLRTLLFDGLRPREGIA